MRIDDPDVMTRLILFLFLIAPASLLAQSQRDSVNIVALLYSDYKALESFDGEAHLKNCTPDYLIESGEVWNLERELAYFKMNVQRKLERHDNISIKYIKIEGALGYAVYELRSEIRENGMITKYRWTETAVFNKVNDAWKIALIHSTRIN